jgi:3alpha(or 20beta)-hydroxysteroid dehydrogenase
MRFWKGIDMARLTGTVALVTGAARGIGAATAQLLAAEGAAVTLADVLDTEGTALAATLGEHARYAHLDVTREQDWLDAVTATEAAFGPVSLLVNNAGILRWGRIEEVPPTDLRDVLDVNLIGPWFGIRSTVPSLRRAGGGVIVNISSTAGLTGYPELGAYTASKWGLRGLTKTAALELAVDNVRVCSIHPGAIRTPMTAGLDIAALVGDQPIARIGEPEEVARMVVFIAADATYSTGTEFILDGGATTGTAPVHPPATT